MLTVKILLVEKDGHPIIHDPRRRVKVGHGKRRFVSLLVPW
jgi:hypothetical protein